MWPRVREREGRTRVKMSDKISNNINWIKTISSLTFSDIFGDENSFRERTKKLDVYKLYQNYVLTNLVVAFFCFCRCNYCHFVFLNFHRTRWNGFRDVIVTIDKAPWFLSQNFLASTLMNFNVRWQFILQ